MKYGSPGKQEYESNCKGLVFFSLRMYGCGGLKERLESQRVASLELQCRDSWVIENIFIGAKARKDYELVVHWMVDNGIIRTICIDLPSLSDTC